MIDPDRRARLLRLATSASVATALVLIAAKVAAWLLTGSVSVLASLVDSLMDAAASVINLVAVRWSLQPADEEHRFGHGKAESLAGLGQATFIAGSALFLILQAISRLIHPEPLYPQRHLHHPVARHHRVREALHQRPDELRIAGADELDLVNPTVAHKVPLIGIPVHIQTRTNV
jgi:divalent metal cation (Fe/Co/Zn/Cd) transporter